MIRQQTVRIKENSDDWTAVNLLYGTAKKYRTLKDALDAIKMSDAKDAKNGKSSITKIEVDTTTRVGKIVAETLLDKEN